MDNVEKMNHAEGFCKLNLEEMCKELIDLSNNGILISGKIRSLASSLDFLPGDQRLSVVMSMVKHAALKHVVSSEEAKPKYIQVDINTELLDALQLLMKEGLDDKWIYDIREREMEGWDGPRVVAANNAVSIIQKLLRGHGRG